MRITDSSEDCKSMVQNQTQKKWSVQKKMTVAVVGIILLTLFLVIFLPENNIVYKSRHFTFSYSSSISQQRIEALAKNLEKAYVSISQKMQTLPEDIIDVNIYAAHWRYAKATGNFMASGSIEGPAKLHFVDEGQSITKVAVHEFTHTVVLKMLIDREPLPFNRDSFEHRFPTFPVWLWEAVSCYEAAQKSDLQKLPYLANGTYPSLAELSNRSAGGKIYAVGYSIIEFILQKWGQQKLVELIHGYGNLSLVWKVTDVEFGRQWYDFIKNKYL